MTVPIRPPFTLETALAEVRTAEEAWNSRDHVRVSLAYSIDSIWRNRDQFLSGGTTTPASGSAATATNSGNSTTMA